MDFKVTFIYPFLPFFAEDIGAKSPSEISLYVGAIVSAYYVGQAFSGGPWGKGTEKSPRRTLHLMIWSLLFSGICLLAFGFSRSIEMALLTRLLMGFLNGVPPVTKKYLVQSVEESRVVSAFSILMFAYVIGSLLGPVVGGFLYDPSTKYGIFSGIEMLATYPILLPCAIASFFSLCGIVVAVMFHNEKSIEEESEEMGPKTSDAVEIEEEILEMEMEMEEIEAAKLERQKMPRKSIDALPRMLREEDEQMDRSYDRAMVDAILVEGTISSLSRVRSNEIVDNADEESSDDDEVAEDAAEKEAHVSSASILEEAMRIDDQKLEAKAEETHEKPHIKDFTPLIILAIISFGCVSLLHISFDTIIPLIIALDKSDGGLNFTAEEIAMAQAFCALVMFFGQGIFYLPIVKRLGVVMTSRLGMVLMVPLFAFFPCIAFTAGKTVFMWGAIGLFMALRAISDVFLYSTLNVIIGQAPDPLVRGRVSGIAHSTMSFMQAVGPFGGCAYFSIVITLDYSVFIRLCSIFAVFVIVALVGCWCIFSTSKDYEYKDVNFVSIESLKGDDGVDIDDYVDDDESVIDGIKCDSLGEQPCANLLDTEDDEDQTFPQTS
jgi:MFS family permease